MNILFLTEKSVFPPIGGTARITSVLSKGLQERGHGCYHAFGKDGLSRENLDKQLKELQIDIVICNLVRIGFKKNVLPVVYDLTRGSSVKVITCLHAMPGEELIGNSVSNSVYRLFRGYNPFLCLKDVILHLAPESVLKFVFSKRLRNRYRILYDYSDKIVLLSHRFLDDFASLGGLKIDDKFCVIHNALSFTNFLDYEKIPEKKKEILMLSRMDEKSKRISDALRIWKMVNNEGNHNDWKLTIVGDGIDLTYFKRIAKRKRLNNISFEGKQENEIAYFERASIFMMTSAYEGWGLTLTEAQQMGVVPIAFESYSSLRDIIEDGRTGIVVKNRVYDDYFRKLISLMDNKEKREYMAKEAIASSHRFSQNVILDQWEALFNL